MESWQVFHIQRNLDALVCNTICNSSFLAILQRDILSEDDISKLQAKELSEGKIAESKLLYEIVLTRKNAYNALIEALRETVQTGSLAILEQATADKPNVCSRVEYIRESTKWSDLSDDIKCEMRNKLVIFQGQQESLEKCCSSDQHSYDGNLLLELAHGRSESAPVLVNNQVPDQVPYYIQRKIRKRTSLNDAVFQHSCTDVFVIQGVSRRELTALADGNETDVSGNQIHRLTVRFILLEYEGDYNKICKLSNFPVHWIQHQDKSYEWVSSSGSVKTLQGYVQNTQDSFLEQELLSLIGNVNKVFVIADSPGMGKSMLVTNIAHDIMQNGDIEDNQKRVIVRFIVMKEMVQAFGNKSVKFDTIIPLLVEHSSEFECGRKLVKDSIISGNCVVIFDGFDEVLTEQVETALEILQVLSTTLFTTSARMIVTTRPHMLDELENALHVFGYSINPFKEEDQMNFLLGFWESQGVQRNESVGKFAKSCLKALTSNMTDFERDIAGIPLQCKLLAETYLEQAERCSKVGHQQYPHSIGLVTSIFDMYERHMNMRLAKICENKSLLQRIFAFIGNWKNSEQDYDSIKKVHMYLALKLLFPDHATEFQSLASSSLISMTNYVCGLGILEATPNQQTDNERIRFVHRTFAEYLIAWFATDEEVWSRAPATVDFILSEILFTTFHEITINHPFRGSQSQIESFKFKFPVVSYFINGFIKKQGVEKSKITSQLSKVLNSNVELAFDTFTASAFHDHAFVPFATSMWLEKGKITYKSSSKPDVRLNKLLTITSKYSGVELMKIFCADLDITSVRLPSWKKSSFMITPLHLAVQRGHYNLVEYLVNQFKNELLNIPYLIHYCVYNSVEDDRAIMKCKKDIIDLLLSKSSQWLDEFIEGSGITPLLQSKMNLELLEHLIQQGTNVNVFVDLGTSVLLLLTREIPVTPESYHRCILLLSERGFKHFNLRDNFQMTPLCWAAKDLELLEETLKLFISNGADINAMVTDEEDSVLFFAIRGGRSACLVSRLVSFGADLEHVNADGKGVLHICALHKNYDALEYFIHNHKLDINLRDKYNTTPLYCTVVQAVGGVKQSDVIERMQRLLIENGADVNVKTVYNKTIFPNAFDVAHSGIPISLPILQLMEERGLEITPQLASTAVRDLLRKTKFEAEDPKLAKVLQYLIEKQKMDLYSDAVYVWNPWKFNRVLKQVGAACKATHITIGLLHQAKTLNLLDDEDILEIWRQQPSDILKNERFYEIVQGKPPGSFELVCLLLLLSNHIKAVEILRSGLKQAELLTQFVTAPSGVSAFSNESPRVVLLKTKEAELAISRLNDSLCYPFHEQLPVFAEHTALSQFPPFKLSVLKWRVLNVTNLRHIESKAAELQAKLICVCGDVDKSENYEVAVLNDSFDWSDISREIYSNLWCIFIGRKLHFTELFANPAVMIKTFGSRMLKSFQLGIICKLSSIQVGHVINSVEVRESSRAAISLSPKIFNYFLPDKFVFQGITEVQLGQYAKFGQKIGNFESYDMKSLDYVLLEQSQTQRFEEICQTTTNNVHLIRHTKQGNFKLVRTWGFDVNIRRFFDNVQEICVEYPDCSCKAGNNNLVANLSFQVQGNIVPESKVHCSVDLNELTPNIRQFVLPPHTRNFGICNTTEKH